MVRTAPSGEDTCAQETRESFRGRYGILALPMALMFTFGLFGFRPGQMMKGMMGYVVNFIFILNFLLILCIGIGYLFTADFQSRILNKLIAIFFIFMMVEFAMLCYIYYKKYNVFYLLEDIRKVRSQTLNKKDLFIIGAFFMSIITSLVIIFYVSMTVILNVFVTGQSFIWKPISIQTDNPTGVKILVIIEILVINTNMSSILITTFMVVVITCVLGKEFEICIEQLQHNIENSRSLSQKSFLEFTEGFYKLKAVLKRVDNTFSAIVGLNLTVSMLMLCGATYVYLIHDKFSENWILFISVAVITSFTLLLSLASLHNKVSNILTINGCLFVPDTNVQCSRNVKSFSGSQCC